MTQDGELKKQIGAIQADLKHWRPSAPVMFGWMVFVGVFLWGYGDTLGKLVGVWWNQDDYGHGFFVIPFSLYLLWYRRNMVRTWPERGSWWGLALMALFAVAWGIYIYFNFRYLAALSILPALAGLTLLVGGWRALHWAWPSILFLFFMIPLPGFLAGALSHDLQKIATHASVFLVQTLGIPSFRHGNVIHLTEGQLGVVEACSGLRMLMLFFAVCIGAAFVLKKRPIWERAVIVVSAVPIAILANVARITVTAVLHELVSTELADKVFHDMAGLLMMPLALTLLWAELALLSQLVMQPVDTGQFSLALGEDLRKSKQPDPSRKK